MITAKQQGKMTLFLSFLVAIGSLSTDMYLPALPALTKLWGVNEATANMTLSLWFVSFSISILIYGPVSDRIGRKPILQIGMVIFTLATAGCALSTNVWGMIVARMFQGMGGAACASMGLAISKDAFEGHIRHKVLAYMGVIMAVMPMAAPTVGGLILKYLEWEWIFWVQCVYGLVASVLVLRMEEPLKKEDRAEKLRFVGRYINLLKNRNFILAAVSMNLVLCPFFAHVSASPYIYMEYFGLSRQIFGIFFAGNAMAMMLGSLFCAKLSSKMSTKRMNTVGFSLVPVGGVLITLFGNSHPLLFALPMMLLSFGCGMSRPLSNNLVLEQVQTDAGSASSVYTFLQFMMAAMFMTSTSNHLLSPQMTVGVMAVGAGGLVLALWPYLLRTLNTEGLT